MKPEKCEVCDRSVTKRHRHGKGISMRVEIDDEFRALEARIRKEMQAVNRVFGLRTKK